MFHRICHKESIEFPAVFQAPERSSKHILITGEHVRSKINRFGNVRSEFPDYKLCFLDRDGPLVADAMVGSVIVEKKKPKKSDEGRYLHGSTWESANAFASCDLLVRNYDKSSEKHRSATYIVTPAHILFSSEMRENAAFEGVDVSSIRESVERNTTKTRYVVKINEDLDNPGEMSQQMSEQQMSRLKDNTAATAAAAESVATGRDVGEFDVGHPALFHYRQWRKCANTEMSGNTRDIVHCPEDRCNSETQVPDNICPHMCLNDIALFRIEDKFVQNKILANVTLRQSSLSVRIRQVSLFRRFTDSQPKIRVGAQSGTIINHLYIRPVGPLAGRKACGYQLCFVLDPMEG